MTQTLQSIIEKEIDLAKASATLPLSVEEIAKRAGYKLGIQVHREQVRRILHELGYTAQDGAHRRWVYQHNPQKGE